MKPKIKPQKIKRPSVGGKTAIRSELYIEQVEGKVERSVLKIIIKFFDKYNFIILYQIYMKYKIFPEPRAKPLQNKQN